MEYGSTPYIGLDQNLNGGKYISTERRVRFTLQMQNQTIQMPEMIKTSNFM
jgi:hypothetical protein